MAVQTADADLDGVSDNETIPCTNPDDQVPDNNGDANSTGDEEDDVTGPFREDAMDRASAKFLLALVIIAAICLIGAGAMMIIEYRKKNAANILIDDIGDTSTEIWEDDTETPVGSVILDGTSVGPNAGSEAREASVGRDDGVFGAPQLDAYNFPGWSPKQVQDSLDAGWTLEQLREKYDSEQS
mgnify:FL=1